MSYWITLYPHRNPELDSSVLAEPVQVPAHQEGGTIALGGTDEATINVTYNYAKFFSFRSLDGMLASETIPLLEAAVKLLGTVRNPDYWATTPGNAGHACNILLGWARLHPTAHWNVS